MDLPEVVTRISEFIPEVVTFIEKLVKNGFAYESNGSVYFDVPAYIESGRKYPWLRPNTGEGENPDEEEKFTSDKKDKRDFALWKKAKEGEPSWDSIWGKGRPGWHVECSVMCASELPTPVDMHSGGVDLKFPHHDNEIA